MVSFGFGLYMDNVAALFMSTLVGVLIIALAVLPDWPFYNRNTLKWMPVPLKESQTPAAASGNQKKKKAQ